MSSINTPHDRFFRKAMSNTQVARDFFEATLDAEFRQRIDLTQLELCPNSFVDQTLQASCSDVLYKTVINEKTSYLYLLCEHQRTPDRFMPLRMLRYILDIWELHRSQYQEKTLPLVVPIVFYNGMHPYNQSTDIRTLINAPSDLIEQVLFKPFLLVDTNALKDTDLEKYPWSGPMMFFMKHISEENFVPFLAKEVNQLSELEKSGATDYVASLLHYALEAGSVLEKEHFFEIISKHLSKESKGELMTLAEELRLEGVIQGREEGRKEMRTLAEELRIEGVMQGREEMKTLAEELRIEGVIQGREEGRQEGERLGFRTGEVTILHTVLLEKFMQIPAVYREKIANAQEDELILWAKNVLRANTLEEVFTECFQIG